MDQENGKIVIRRQAIRLDLPIHEKYDDFLVRFESAVPVRCFGRVLIKQISFDQTLSLNSLPSPDLLA